MDDNQLLAQIGKMMDEKLSPIYTDIQKLQDGQQRIALILENEIGPQIKALHDGHFQQERSKANVSDLGDIIETQHLHAATLKDHTKQLQELRKAAP